MQASILFLSSSFDPWWELFMPALFGEEALVADVIWDIPNLCPREALPDAYAVAARALCLIGQTVPAAELLDRAFIEGGGPEVAALATFMLEGGRTYAEARIASEELRPGLRADAACDLAVLRLLADDLEGARAAIAQAEALCPEHAETGRWQRFLSTSEDPVRDAKQGAELADLRARRRPPGKAARLMPNARSGWRSQERHERRLIGVPPVASWAPPETALGRMQDIGVHAFFFDIDVSYRRRSADSPLVALEILADRIQSLLNEKRDPVALAEMLWSQAQALDETAALDAAQILLGFATQDACLAPLGLSALSFLVDRRPEMARLWRGYRAWLSHLAGKDGVEPARALLGEKGPFFDLLPDRMAIETLLAAGCRGDVEMFLDALDTEDERGPIATERLSRTEPFPFRMIVSGRTKPRDA